MQFIIALQVLKGNFRLFLPLLSYSNLVTSRIVRPVSSSAAPHSVSDAANTMGDRTDGRTDERTDRGHGWIQLVHLERHVHRKPSHRRQRVYVSEGLVGPVLGFKVVAPQLARDTSMRIATNLFSFHRSCSVKIFFLEFKTLSGHRSSVACRLLLLVLHQEGGLHDFVVCLPIQCPLSFSGW